MAEAALFVFILVAFALLLFGPFTHAEEPFLRNYMLFPLLIWIAFRFTPREMANALLVFAVIAVWNTLQGHGIFAFAGQTRTAHLISLQIYLSVAVFSGLLLSAVVAERRQTEYDLRTNETNLRAIIDLSPVPMALNDDRQNITFLNPAFIEAFGYALEDIPTLSHWWLNAYPDPQYRQQVTDTWSMELEKVKRAGHAFPPMEVNVKCKNGTTKTILANAVFFSKSFKDNHLVALYDITDRKQAEAALRASEEKYRLVANFTYDWEAWHAPYGVYLYVSPSCERVTGYTADEFIADANLVVKITHPDDRASVVNHFQAITHQSKQRNVEFDFRIITKSGETRWINHSCTAVYGDDGKWLGRRESNRDVTARRQSEAVLRSRLRLGQFADTHTVDEVLLYAIDEVETLTESRIGFFHALNPDQKTLTLQTWSTNTILNTCAAEGNEQHHSIHQAGAWADCVYKREPVIYNDYPGLPAARRKGTPAGHAPLTRILVVPVIRNDVIVAVLGVGNKQANYDYQDVKTILQITDLAWDVILRKRLEEETRRTKEALEVANQGLQAALEREKELSHTDVLTGVNNRRYLFELAEREFNIAARHQLPLTVMMFDIDHFKQVNDVFGHDAGDRVLQRVVEAARAELRSSDVIGRYGGEEFVIILPLTTAQQAYPVAERIRASVEALRISTHKEDAAATLSLGIVELVFKSREIESVDDLIRCADEAMYAAKQAGRNRISIFERT